LLLAGYEDTRAAIAAHFTHPEAPLAAKVSFHATINYFAPSRAGEEVLSVASLCL